MFVESCPGSTVSAILLYGWILRTGGVALGRVWPTACAAGLLADPGKARGCYTNTFVIDSLSRSWFVKISLQRRHALTVADGAFSHEIVYVTIF